MIRTDSGEREALHLFGKHVSWAPHLLAGDPSIQELGVILEAARRCASPGYPLRWPVRPSTAVISGAYWLAFAALGLLLAW